MDEIVVVEGAHELAADTTRIVHCADWERGPGASLRCGLAALTHDVEAAVIVLADGPSLSPRAVDRVLAEWRRARRSRRCVLRRGSRPSARARKERIGLTSQTRVSATEPVALVPCDDLGAPGDVDVPEDLDAL